MSELDDVALYAAIKQINSEKTQEVLEALLKCAVRLELLFSDHEERLAMLELGEEEEDEAE